MDISLLRIFFLVGGFTIYIVLTFLSRSVQNKAFSTVSEEQKKSLFDAFASFRKYNLVPGVVILVLYILLVKLLPALRLFTNIGFAALYLSYLVATLLFIYFRLKKLNIDKPVRVKVVVGLSLQYIGMIFVVVALLAYFVVQNIFHLT